MAENRYHIILGVPEEIQNPDYFQLLGLSVQDAVPQAVDVAFKVKMNQLQHLESPKHKEFVEFLKGEVRKARKILTDKSRRAEYENELREERMGEIRKILGHILVGGELSTKEEISVISEGQNLGLDKDSLQRVIEEEVKKYGARRVSSSKTDLSTQKEMDDRTTIVRRELEGVKLDMILQRARAKRAELKEQRAEGKQKIAEHKAKAAMERMRSAIVKEQKIAVREKKQLANTSQQVRSMLAEKDRKIEELRKALDAEGEADDREKQRGAFLIGCLLTLVFYVGLQATAAAFPDAFRSLNEITSRLAAKLPGMGTLEVIALPFLALAIGLLMLSIFSRVARFLAYLIAPVAAGLIFFAQRLAA